ncbi:MAG TPA: NapC/NirT family cytochrome c [Candidatus Acidoferrales bacterium]|nr:NapC/NirT family cytochrome c [Candidatus Acidoferrales bacterium]
MTLDPELSGTAGPAPADAEPGDAVAATDDAATTAGEPAAATPARFGRVGRAFRRLRPKGRRGQLILLFMVAGFAVAMTAGGVAALQWTETADFCGRCHTMGPELKGHAISAHREVACAECHVEPGIQGWIKAKINGTKQLIEVMTGTFPTPIPPPGHGDLPPTTATCRRCHDVAALLENGGPIKFVLKTRYDTDILNTRSSVALVIRPEGLGEGISTKGIHWHVVSDVEFSASDARNQKIDVVRITDPDGTKTEYVATSQVNDPTNVQADVDRLIAADRTSRMDCIDCHNRAGHSVPTLSDAIDQAMLLNQIDPTLPFIKKAAVTTLSGIYASDADADAAIERIRDYYALSFPLVARDKAGAIYTAIANIKVIYQLVATPEMQVSTQTYPNNLGHTEYPGCFRCHDGGHYKVVAGKITNETIPSGCATCHTFPQIGANTSAILIGQRPDTHLDKLWVFNHKSMVSTLDPSSTTCGACHTRTYCENCHTTAAVQVPHDEMVFNHASVIRRTGSAACTLCHQQSYCSQCHATNVLPIDNLPIPGASLLPSPGWSLQTP